LARDRPLLDLRNPTTFGLAAPPCVAPLPGDHRFDDEGWQGAPYRVSAQGFLLAQQWWHEVTREVPGLMPHHRDMASFAARQILSAATSRHSGQGDLPQPSFDSLRYAPATETVYPSRC
jgi:hypothetical protein